MFKVSGKELNAWFHNQIKIGGEEDSLYFLLDSVAGVSRYDLYNARIDPLRGVYLKENLYSLTSKWEEHLINKTPIQHICKCTFWRDLKLEISNDALIPRVETESIVDIVFNIFPHKKENLMFADLGTGSGAIAISLSILNPSWRGLATDIDEKALNLAKKNFKDCTNQSNLSFHLGDWWTPLSEFAGKIDLAISNPPYIPKLVYEKLPKSVQFFEPRIALDGGLNGLLHIEKIIKDAPKYLKKGSWLIFENHFDQSELIKIIF